MWQIKPKVGHVKSMLILARSRSFSLFPLEQGAPITTVYVNCCHSSARMTLLFPGAARDRLFRTRKKYLELGLALMRWYFISRRSLGNANPECTVMNTHSEESFLSKHLDGVHPQLRSSTILQTYWGQIWPSWMALELEGQTPKHFFHLDTELQKKNKLLSTQQSAHTFANRRGVTYPCCSDSSRFAIEHYPTGRQVYLYSSTGVNGRSSGRTNLIVAIEVPDKQRGAGVMITFAHFCFVLSSCSFTEPIREKQTRECWSHVKQIRR